MSDWEPSDRPRDLPGWFITHPKTLITLGVLALLFLGTTLSNNLAERRLQSRIAAIRAQGEPTTCEDLKAAIPKIPPGENMAVRILEVSKKMMTSKLPDESSARLPLIGEARSGRTGRRLPPDQLEAIREYLSRFPEELAGLHEALKTEKGCPEVAWQGPLATVVMPELVEMRHAAKVLALEAAVAAEDSDSQQAAARLFELCRLESTFECEPFLIAALVRISMLALAADRVERTVNQCGLDGGLLREFQRRFSIAENAIDIKTALMTERVVFIDVAEWLRTGKGSLSGVTGRVGEDLLSGWRCVPVLPALDAASGLEIYGALIDAIDQPDAASIQRIRAAEFRVKTLPWYNPVSRIMIPNLTRAVELWVRGVALNRAIQAALASERCRLARGDWPESLQSLVPDYLAAVPVDPFDGTPIRYLRIPEGIKIWSIGEDLTDDGGQLFRLEVPENNQKPPDHGWVLLNPDLRGRPAEPATTQAGP